MECNHEDYNADCYKCHMRFANKILEIDSGDNIDRNGDE
jgi:hypothetical protein